ncbi:hypothetical protein [Metabacillus fastidiosus]|uniref:hypothetical protein n=1 Tax=Metabacillus fastidiosus TaxID=1458 RepID=UPI003D2A9C43
MKNLIGFILKVLKEAEYRIKFFEKQSERMDNGDNKVTQFDYHKVWKAAKKKHQVEKSEENKQEEQKGKVAYEVDKLSIVEPKIEKMSKFELYRYIPE